MTENKTFPQLNIHKAPARYLCRAIAPKSLKQVALCCDVCGNKEQKFA